MKKRLTALFLLTSTMVLAASPAFAGTTMMG